MQRPNKPTRRELALALGLKPPQLARIMRIGVVAITTRRKTLDAIKAVELSLTEASEIWGLSASAGRLKQCVYSEDLPISNLGEVYSRYNPYRVTVGSMLDLMEKLNRPSWGFRG